MKIKYDIANMNVDIEALNNVMIGNSIYLSNSFKWETTPQGLEYWHDQYRGKRPINYSELDNIRIQYHEYTFQQAPECAIVNSEFAVLFDVIKSSKMDVSDELMKAIKKTQRDIIRELRNLAEYNR